MEEVIQQVETFLQQYGHIMLTWVLIGVAILIAIGIALLWVQSRAKFIFLDNVINNRGQITEPWHTYRASGNSLLGWHIVYGIVCFVITAALLAIGFYTIALPCYHARKFVPAVLPSAITLGTLLLVFVFITGFIARILEDFVIPIMYQTGLSAVKAWGRWLSLMRGNFWRLILYWIMYGLLGIAAGAAVFLFALATLCIACCVMMIPYIGTVLLLPVFVFFRAYSVTYLAQFADDVVLFADDQ
jgi:hypothetical protein